MAIEDEIRRWNGLAKVLRKEDRKPLTYSSMHAEAKRQLEVTPLSRYLFEPMIMPILVSSKSACKGYKRKWMTSNKNSAVTPNFSCIEFEHRKRDLRTNLP
jgi:hypothetical protein